MGSSSRAPTGSLLGLGKARSPGKQRPSDPEGERGRRRWVCRGDREPALPARSPDPGLPRLGPVPASLWMLRPLPVPPCPAGRRSAIPSSLRSLRASQRRSAPRPHHRDTGAGRSGRVLWVPADAGMQAPLGAAPGARRLIWWMPWVLHASKTRERCGKRPVGFLA